MKHANLCLLTLCLAAGPALGQDVSSGALLYETHCVSCHREGLHDRKGSKVKTYADLRAQVQRWTAQAGRRFTPSEIENLIEFLDRSHYRLDLQPRGNPKS